MTSTESSTTPSVAAPAGGREHAIDALRGFALLGILMVNAGSFASTYFGVGVVDPAFSRPVDHAVRWWVSFVFETKFYLLFSFLFGYSFTLQMAAAERADAAFAPRMVRRQLALLIVGVVHGALLYYGEILSTYALLGLVLLAARSLEPAKACRWGIGLVVVACSGWMLLGVLQILEGDTSGAASSEPATKLAAFSGSALDTLRFHSGHLWNTVQALWLLQGPSALAMFFFGGPTLHYFALALTIGILFGIYSSVFVAAALAMWLGVKREDLIKPVKVKDENGGAVV